MTPEKPTPYEKLALLRMLSHGHGQADAYFETLGDAAALAAGQVRDVRLEFLEKGPTVTFTDAVLELLLAVSVQYVGGRVVELATKEVLTRILSTRSALLRVAGRTEFGDQVATAYRQAGFLKAVETGLAGQIDSIQSFGDVLLRLRGPKEYYSDTPFQIADLAAKVVFHLGRKLPGSPPNYTRLSPRDSPGVAMLDNVSLFVTRQKAFNRMVFEDLAHIVHLDLLDKETVSGLIRDLEGFAEALYGGMPLARVKQHYKLFFEACIWSRYFPSMPRIRGQPTVLDLGGGRSLDFTNYLLDRIVSPHEGLPFGSLISGLPEPLRRRRDEPDNRYFVLQSLREYLWGDGPHSLRAAIGAAEDRLPPEGRPVWAHP